MASIRSQLVLNDGMSAPLRSINKALNIVLNSFENMQDISGRSINTAAIQEAREELAKASAALDNVEQRTQKTSNAFGQLAKAIGLVAIARKSLDVIKTGIDYASDLAEVQNVVDVTFGRSAATINAWSKECLNVYGMNEVSAKRYAGTLGAMLKSAGLTGDSIVGMSQKMVGLAGDMASFYNLDLETAFEKIRSGISGETEPLKQLGVNMSVANLEAYALSQGIKTAYSDMSQAEQVMLRYNYLLNTTADAQGDFARTSNSWANQTRLLSEGWLEFTGVLAERLLPVLTQVVSWLNGIVEFLTTHADTVSAVLLGLVVTVSILAGAWAIHAAAQWLAVEANQALIASLLSNPITWIALAIGVLVAMIYKWIQSVGGLKNAWEICKAALVVAWLGLQVGFYAAVYGIMNLVDKLKLCWQKAGVAIANYMGDMKVSILTILQSTVNGAIDIINKFISVLNNLPGVSIDAVEHMTFAVTASAENEAAKISRASELSSYESELADKKSERDAAYAATKAELANATKALSTLYSTSRAEAASKKDIADSISDSSVGENIANTAGNTKKAADSAGSAANSLKGTTEDLKYLRDLAEQETINRFTTAEVKIDMTGMTNRIDSEMDLDGVLTIFTKGFAEALETAAEGVHA